MKIRAAAAAAAATALVGLAAVAGTPANAASATSIRSDSDVVSSQASAGGATTQGIDWLFCYWQPKFCNSYKW